MGNFRKSLPQLSGDFFLTDGGLETTLIFHNGIDLPEFAAIDLLRRQSGIATLKDYYRTYVQIAQERGAGFILESATWRSSSDWGDKLGISSEELASLNRKAIALLVEIKEEFSGAGIDIVVSGCAGPRGDGYSPESIMSEDEAEKYHRPQISLFAESPADMVAAVTMTNPAEAIGIARAARSVNLPVAISFTVETDGKLPTGESLQEAIEVVDKRTGDGPAYYMINCAHPTHFKDTLVAGESWTGRIRGLRANASRLSHAELDEAEELDDGNPEEFGEQYSALQNEFNHLNIFGGCCGTDDRHVRAVSRACN